MFSFLFLHNVPVTHIQLTIQSWVRSGASLAFFSGRTTSCRFVVRCVLFPSPSADLQIATVFEIGLPTLFVMILVIIRHVINSNNDIKVCTHLLFASA